MVLAKKNRKWTLPTALALTAATEPHRDESALTIAEFPSDMPQIRRRNSSRPVDFGKTLSRGTLFRNEHVMIVVQISGGWMFSTALDLI